jgi:hypothetical protein
MENKSEKQEVIKFYLSYKNGEQDYASRYYEAENLLQAEELITRYREKTLELYPKENLKTIKVQVIGLNTKAKKDLDSIAKKVNKKK